MIPTTADVAVQPLRVAGMTILMSRIPGEARRRC